MQKKLRENSHPNANKIAHQRHCVLDRLSLQPAVEKNPRVRKILKDDPKSKGQNLTKMLI